MNIARSEVGANRMPGGPTLVRYGVPFDATRAAFEMSAKKTATTGMITRASLRDVLSLLISKLVFIVLPG